MNEYLGVPPPVRQNLAQHFDMARDDPLGAFNGVPTAELVKLLATLVQNAQAGAPHPTVAPQAAAAPQPGAAPFPPDVRAPFIPADAPIHQQQGGLRQQPGGLPGTDDDQGPPSGNPRERVRRRVDDLNLGRAPAGLNGGAAAADEVM